MSRWYIEKSGTGIEKSGTGIEKSGTGIEKSGTGIEKSGTGIEKSGTGIQRFIWACAFTAITFASQISASEEIGPAGSMTVVVNDNTVAVSWIIDGSVFSGVASLTGSFANLALTEIGLVDGAKNELMIAGSGTGKDIAGSGTGKDIAGSGTGKDIAGSGTGVDIAGSGTGADIAGSGTGADIAGSGTGADIAGSGTGADIAGSGTGSDIAGSGTGSDSLTINGNSSIMIAGSGTGSDSIVITLPGGTDMQMEVALGCNSATVSIMDSNFAEVVSFNNVPVIGASGFCTGGRNFNNFGTGKVPSKIGDDR